MRFYTFSLDCETCGDPMLLRIADLTAPDDGSEMVINIEMALSQEAFDCRNCGGSTYLGDIDEICHHEPGEESDEDDEDDE